MMRVDAKNLANSLVYGVYIYIFNSRVPMVDKPSYYISE